MAGPRSADGRQVYPGYLYDMDITTTAPGMIPGVLNGAPSPVGPRTPPTTQDAEVAEVLAAPNTLGDAATWTNLINFHRKCR